MNTVCASCLATNRLPDERINDAAKFWRVNPTRRAYRPPNGPSAGDGVVAS